MAGKQNPCKHRFMSLGFFFLFNLVVMASKDDAPPLQIFAGLEGLFYFLVDKSVEFVDKDWTMPLQLTFWFLMLALLLYLLDARYS